MNLGKLREICNERNISIARLERDVGLSHGTVSKWTVSNPRVDILKRVADYLGLTVDDLL